MLRFVSYLEAARLVLKDNMRPMTSRELVSAAVRLGIIEPKGSTPHKTMNARISEDIVANPNTEFMRSDHGQFALKSWSDFVVEFRTRPRKINPIDEDILVVPRLIFEEYLENSVEVFPRFYQMSPYGLLALTVTKKRAEVEEDNDYVQVVSLFHVKWEDKLLTYRRTSRLPERRLHHARSINFGGHMIAGDRAPMFEKFLADEMPVIFSRELYEELRFESPPSSVRYEGALHSKTDSFSSRHVGVCFQVEPRSTHIESAEPGFHTDVQFLPIAGIYEQAGDFDEWTRLVIERMAYVADRSGQK